VQSHDRSIGYVTTIQILPYSPTEIRRRLRHTCMTRSRVRTRTSLKVLAVYVLKVLHKYHLSDVAGRCQVQLPDRKVAPHIYGKVMQRVRCGIFRGILVSLTP
jgi:hypothetical protein